MLYQNYDTGSDAYILKWTDNWSDRPFEITKVHVVKQKGVYKIYDLSGKEPFLLNLIENPAYLKDDYFDTHAEAMSAAKSRIYDKINVWFTEEKQCLTGLNRQHYS